MNQEPDFLQNLRRELSNWHLWADRSIVLGYAVVAGLFVVGFTMAAQWAFAAFERLQDGRPWVVLAWTPLLTAGLVWVTRRWFPGAAGSGIPQIKAALDPAVPPGRRGLFAS
jgi:H+/Cl- antiporter ClcA